MIPASPMRYVCPACGQKHPRPGLKVTLRCPCGEVSLLPPPPPLHGFLPIVVAWGLAPALAGTACGSLHGTSAASMATLVILAAPLIAYSWSCYVLYRCRPSGLSTFIQSDPASAEEHSCTGR